MKKITFLVLGLIIVIIILVFVFSSFYILDQTQTAVVLRFGQIVKINEQAGLSFKTPFVDNVEKFEKRVMIYDISPERVITADKKTIVVDTYSLWKISDPKLFIETMRTVNMALSRIDDVVYSHARDIIAKYDFEEILSKKRFEILDSILEKTKADLKIFGIDVVDVRIKRNDLPEENRNSVYNRMNSERYSIATQIRAEGEGQAQQIKAEADKQVKIILSDAERESKIIKGTADASSIKIYADAFSESPEFFELRKLTEIYQNSFKDSILVIPQDSDILKYFKEVK
ncbi:MAG: protease modulator HflC [Thermotogae bacterium]|nr:protease modulator HflC [Thermotogota bacterium]